MTFPRLFFPLASISAAAISVSAQIVWDTDNADGPVGDGVTWSDGGNWIGGVVPTTSDTIDLDGQTVSVNNPGQGYSYPPGTAGGTININSGGELEAAGPLWGTLRRIDAINVNNGGKLSTGEDTAIRTDITIAQGGTMVGSGVLRDAKELQIDGTFEPLDTINGSNVFAIGESTTRGRLTLGATGTLVLDVFGDGISEYLDMVNASISQELMDISSGSVLLRVQGAYTPTIGHSFNLWDNTAGSPNIFVGSGSQVGFDGAFSGLQLDTSQWASDGIVTVVPEPSSMALSAGFLALAALLVLRRRE